MPRKRGHRNIADIEDCTIEHLDFRELLGALYRRPTLRARLEQYVAYMRDGKRVKARRCFADLYDFVILRNALLSERAGDQIKAAEIGLLFAGERPAEKLEHTGKDGGPIETKTDLSGLNTEELRQLRTLMQKARRAGAE